MIINDKFISDIEKLIGSIEREYQGNKGLILTEGDLASLIYCRIRSYFFPLNRQNNSGLRWRMRTQDQYIYASPVHTEVPWYDSSGKLTIRPDITILEPSKLSILHRYRNGFKLIINSDSSGLPSKQFEFGGDAILMELKFIRNKSGITRRTVNKFKADYEKIRKLRKRHGLSDNEIGTFYSFFIIFNKTDKRCLEFDQFLIEHENSIWYKFLYGTGQVTFR
jgi:hypothetical protein